LGNASWNLEAITKGGDDIYPWAGVPTELVLVCLFLRKKQLGIKSTLHANKTQGDRLKICGVLFGPKNCILLTLPPNSPEAIK